MQKITFRPDLEGLRGFALLMVILFHYQIPPFTGGYIGVDIFFVLSGYLLTSIILKDLHSNTFSFREFYYRRIVRLAPAAIFVTFTSFVLFSFILAPSEYIDFSRSIREFFTFRSNYFFADELNNYFATSATSLPLLHTWSLSVEWQFYFAFPLILFLLKKSIIATKVTMVVLLIALCTLSIALSTQESSYFLTHTRAFEFITGAIPALFPKKFSESHSKFASTISILCLLLLTLLFNKSHPYPGWYAVAVCNFSLVILYTGNHNGILRHNLMRWLGKISYSTYLWHWPIYVYFNLSFGTVSLFSTILAIALSLFMGHLTQKYIENIAKNRVHTFAFSFGLLALLPYLISLASFSIIRSQDGIPARLGPIAEHGYLTVKQHKNPLRSHCHEFKGHNIEECTIGETNSYQKTALLIGDSHALHSLEFFETILKGANIKGIVQSEPECLMLPNTSSGQNKVRCKRRTQEMYDYIDKIGFDYVILAHRWRGYGNQVNQNTLSQALNRVSASGAKPVIFMPIAEGGGEDLYECFYRNIHNLRKCDITKNDSTERLKYVYSQLSALKNVIFIDPQAVQCEGGICSTTQDGVPEYTDSHHINEWASQRLAEKYLSNFGNPLH